MHILLRYSEYCRVKSAVFLNPATHFGNNNTVASFLKASFSSAFYFFCKRSLTKFWPIDCCIIILPDNAPNCLSYLLKVIAMLLQMKIPPGSSLVF
jgi:hypothetical protein